MALALTFCVPKHVIFGAMVSNKFSWKLHVDELPDESVAIKVTVWLEVPDKTTPDTGDCLIIKESQLSDVVANGL